MKLRPIRDLGILALSALTLTWVLVAWRDRPASEPRISAPPTSDREPASEAPRDVANAGASTRTTPRSEGQVGAASSLEVRSDTGLRLPFVLLDDASGGDAIQRPLENGLVERPPWSTLAASAPGHDRVLIPAGVARVTLRARLAFVLRCPGLARHVERVEFMPAFGDGFRTEARALCMHGFPDQDTCVLAGVDEVVPDFGSPTLEIALNLDVDRVVRLFRRTDVTGTIHVDLDPAIFAVDGPLVPLRLRVTPWSEPARARLRVWSTRPTEDAKSLRSIHDWGVLQVDPRRVDASIDRVLTDGTVELRPIALGTDLGASVVTPDTGAYGRAFFVHGGAEQRVELTQPTLVTWTLAPSRTVTRPRTVRVTAVCTRSDGVNADIDRHAWRQEWIAVEPDADGGWFVRVPRAAPMFRDASAECPDSADIVLEAPGMESRSFHVALAPGRTVDLGVVALTELRVHVLLRGSSELEIDSSLAHVIVRGRRLQFRVRGTRALDDGSLLTWLVRSEDGSLAGDDAASADGPNGELDAVALAVQSHDGRQHYFEVGAEGALDPVASESVDVTFHALASPPHEKDLFVRFGLTWRGLDVVLGGVHLRRGSRRSVPIEVPAGGATFWYDGPVQSSHFPRRERAIGATAIEIDVAN